jgi:protein-tyrosine-phosphatase
MKPRSVLFACNWNTVRSPMAVGLLRRLDGGLRVESCGLYAGETVDPFAWAVMHEIGIDLEAHAPRTFADVEPGAFDLIIALTPEAGPPADALSARDSVPVEHWSIDDPALQEGSREQRLVAYRDARDELGRRLAERFGES